MRKGEWKVEIKRALKGEEGRIRQANERVNGE